MAVNTMTDEHYYNRGREWARENDGSPSPITKNLPAILKMAFCDGVNDQRRTYWPAWPYTPE
jgi:hypothetical protein